MELLSSLRSSNIIALIFITCAECIKIRIVSLGPSPFYMCTFFLDFFLEEKKTELLPLLFHFSLEHACVCIYVFLIFRKRAYYAEDKYVLRKCIESCRKCGIKVSPVAYFDRLFCAVSDDIL